MPNKVFEVRVCTCQCAFVVSHDQETCRWLESLSLQGRVDSLLRVSQVLVVSGSFVQTAVGVTAIFVVVAIRSVVGVNTDFVTVRCCMSLLVCAW